MRQCVTRTFLWHANQCCTNPLAAHGTQICGCDWRGPSLTSQICAWSSSSFSPFSLRFETSRRSAGDFLEGFLKLAVCTIWYHWRSSKLWIGTLGVGLRLLSASSFSTLLIENSRRGVGHDLCVRFCFVFASSFSAFVDQENRHSNELMRRAFRCR